MDNYVITIARGYGSGGRTVGHMLAEELGIQYYSSEILKMASDVSGIHEGLFGKTNEKLKSSLLPRVAKDIYKGELISPDSKDYTSEKNLFNFQAKVIKELAEKESFVVIGRCADFVLKDKPNVLRVFVHAPMDYCITRVQQQENKTREQIKSMIQKIDKTRSDYYTHYTGQDWTDARNYDLCLNTNEMSFEQCVEAIKAILKIKGFVG